MLKEGFYECCSTPHKWVIDAVTSVRESRDKKLWQLWFETCAVGKFMEAVGLPLGTGPVLVEGFRCYTAAPAA